MNEILNRQMKFFDDSVGTMNCCLNLRMCRPSGATAPEGRIPSPEGKVPQCAHWGGRGMATAYERYAAKVKWYNVEGRTILTNCLGFQNISPFLFSHKKWFRRAISCASY